MPVSWVTPDSVMGSGATRMGTVGTDVDSVMGPKVTDVLSEGPLSGS